MQHKDVDLGKEEEEEEEVVSCGSQASRCVASLLRVFVTSQVVLQLGGRPGKYPCSGPRHTLRTAPNTYTTKATGLPSVV